MKPTILFLIALALSFDSFAANTCEQAMDPIQPIRGSIKYSEAPKELQDVVRSYLERQGYIQKGERPENFLGSEKISVQEHTIDGKKDYYLIVLDAGGNHLGPIVRKVSHRLIGEMQDGAYTYFDAIQPTRGSIKYSEAPKELQDVVRSYLERQDYIQKGERPENFLGSEKISVQEHTINGKKDYYLIVLDAGGNHLGPIVRKVSHRLIGEMQDGAYTYFDAIQPTRGSIKYSEAPKELQDVVRSYLERQGYIQKGERPENFLGSEKISVQEHTINGKKDYYLIVLDAGGNHLGPIVSKVFHKLVGEMQDGLITLF